MEFFSEDTFSDLQAYCSDLPQMPLSLLDSTLVKPEEDDRLVSLVDSPLGSPLSSEPTSPSLPKSEVPSLISSPESPFNLFDQFNISNPETMYDINTALPDDKKLEAILDNDTDSLDNWISNTVSSDIPIIDLSPDVAAALLAGIPPASTLSTESNDISPDPEISQYDASEVGSTISDDIELNGDITVFTDLTDEDLLQLSVKSLNKRLANYPKNAQRMLKQKRRTLKNRGYAQNCRTKRMRNQSELEQDNDSLVQQLHSLKKQLGSCKGIVMENETMKAELHLLRNEVTNLRQENQILKISKVSH